MAPTSHIAAISCALPGCGGFCPAGVLFWHVSSKSIFCKALFNSTRRYQSLFSEPRAMHGVPFLSAVLFLGGCVEEVQFVPAFFRCAFILRYYLAYSFRYSRQPMICGPAINIHRQMWRRVPRKFVHCFHIRTSRNHQIDICGATRMEVQLPVLGRDGGGMPAFCRSS